MTTLRNTVNIGALPMSEFDIDMLQQLLVAAHEKQGKLASMSNNTKTMAHPVERPDAILAGVAGNAFQAYNAMETTKRKHYQLLEILDNKKKNYNLDPNHREQTLLASLLKDHDEQVKRFTTLSSQLKQADAEAHKALFVYIGAISDIEQKTVQTH